MSHNQTSDYGRTTYRDVFSDARIEEAMSGTRRSLGVRRVHDVGRGSLFWKSMPPVAQKASGARGAAGRASPNV